jgi:hypothetical protein
LMEVTESNWFSRSPSRCVPMIYLSFSDRQLQFFGTILTVAAECETLPTDRQCLQQPVVK